MGFQDDDDGVSIRLERTRILILNYGLAKRPGWLPYIFTVFDTHRKRYIKDKTYSYYDKRSKTVVVPRTCDVGKITNRVRSQGLWINDITDATNENLVEFWDFSHPIRIRDEYHPKNDEQVETIEFLTERARNNIHFRLVSLPTGSGKTFCAINAMCRYNRKVLIVASALVGQWVDEILKFTDIHHTKIHEIKDSVNSIKNLLTNRYNRDSFDVYVASLKTLINACDEENTYERFIRKMGIGLKIVDEIHLQTYSHIWLDMQVPIQETIYLSATPGRSDRNEHYTLGQIFKNLPIFGEMIGETREKYLNCIYVFFDTKPTFMDTKKCVNCHGFQAIAYSKHLFSERNIEMVFDIIKWAIDTTLSAIDDDEKIVVIMEMVEHINIVKTALEETNPGVTVGNYTGSDKHKRDELRAQVILTTDSSFGTGSDLRGKLRVLINTTTFKSHITAKQLPGRIRKIPGKSVYYIDMVNRGFRDTMRHYEERSKVINKYALSVQKRTYGIDI